MTHEQMMERLKTAAQTILRDPAAHGLTRCALCQGAIEHIGFFFPDRKAAKRLGEPKHKTRAMIAYGVCERCFALPDRDTRIETSMFAAFDARGRKIQ